MKHFYETAADNIGFKFDIVGCCDAEFQEKLYHGLLS